MRPHGAHGALALLLAAGLAACGPTREERAGGGPGASEPRPPGTPRAEADAPPPHCDGAWVPVWRDGEPDDVVCEDGAAAAGLTVVDLSDDWTPRIFRGDPALGSRGRASYHARYLAHAREEHPAGTPRWRRRHPPERFLELYGIFPTVGVVRGRLLDEARHACHDGVDDEALAALDEPLRPWSHGGRGRQRARAGWVARTERVLEEVRAARGLADVAALADDPRWGPKLARLRRARGPVDATKAAQAHLACDGLLGDGAHPGVFDRDMLEALEPWQRKHMIVSNGVLDADTRDALVRDSREGDFRALLRVLRERVADAAGLLADGTAAGDVGLVLGRTLDPPELRVTAERAPMPDAAPDVVARATEAAARALGWTTPDRAAAWLAALEGDGTARLRVAVPLPPAPEWHEGGGPLDVVARIDRGDVSYTFPYHEDGRPRWRPMRVRPTLRVYARHDGREIPLVRWSTTIGGWHEETGPDGEVGLAYKNSPVGRRVWRDLVASPTWMPPPATPDGQLLRAGEDLLGPGYGSAFGLVMIQHDRVFGADVERVLDGTYREDDLAPRAEGDEGPPRPVRLSDEGIRTHGSVSYRSMLRGESHGCHRLFNHLAVRLAGWLLTHREHVRRGPQPVHYRRVVYEADAAPADGEAGAEGEGEGEGKLLAVDTRGDLFELTPPVEVVVERGQIRGWPKRPIEGVLPIPLPPGEDDPPAEAGDDAPGEAEGQVAAPPAATAAPAG